MPQFSNQQYFTWISLVVFFVLSVFVIRTQVADQFTDQLYHDANGYAVTAELFADSFAETIPKIVATRTIGYPIFLYVIYELSGQTDDWISQVRMIQFLLHTVVSVMSLGLLQALVSDSTMIRWWHYALLFCVNQFNPILLGLTQEILTDSLAVFWVVLFFWGIMGQSRWRWGIGGAALGLATLVRPFYLLYGFVIFAVWSVGYLIANRQHLKSLLLSNAVIERILFILVPFLVLIAPQYGFVYDSESTIGLVGTRGNQWQAFHYENGFYLYKYETFVGEGHHPGVYYVASDRVDYLDDRSPERGLHLYLQDPFGSIEMAIIKTVGIFQNFELSVYRQALVFDYWQPVFLFGGLFFILLLYPTLYSLQHIKDVLQFNNLQYFLLAILIHILAYTVFLIPEGRFISPVYPLISVLAIATIIRDPSSWWLLLVAIFLGSGLYAVVFNTLRDSML